MVTCRGTLNLDELSELGVSFRLAYILIFRKRVVSMEDQISGISQIQIHRLQFIQILKNSVGVFIYGTSQRFKSKAFNRQTVFRC